eukprot:CAMPEP_0206272016 /NCGR_PEP_ID=MMETSP0047_2-20121206/33760_1 /ASSEMBLY_ACC=CAM_ASM_000192 /TAXON_ID=195065 /ORGANISM="Chroomonas mesostigmatica_cf, Strain CCMP1168" /LENGTH=67 /DNA_ID=CAMNT_0053700863 /DNA_START=28 /DNA_END=228 /DNA_ORIENTATION=-
MELRKRMGNDAFSDFFEAGASGSSLNEIATQRAQACIANLAMSSGVEDAPTSRNITEVMGEREDALR